jgi:T5SS/PEP-CTERM-associated repeat protein
MMETDRKIHTSYRKPMIRLASAVICCLGLLLVASPASADVTWTGDISPGAPTSWNSGDHAYVGRTGTGTVDITNGGTIITWSSYLGHEAGSNGTVTIDGDGSSWTNSPSSAQNIGQVFVGYHGTGELNITGGGSVAADRGRIGYYGDGSGEATVDGAGSALSIDEWLYIGGHGYGELSITDGGAVNSGYGRVGEAVANSGMVTVDGAGSNWTMSNTFWVGSVGSGAVSITNGATISNTQGTITGHSNSDVPSTVTVDGIGSTWTNTAYLYVGFEDVAILTISAGGTVTSIEGIIGTMPDSDGTVSVAGAGSNWTNTNSIEMGWQGTVALAVTDGGTVSSNDTTVGKGSNSSATATIDGVGSQLTNTTFLYVGGEGTGELTITNGGASSSADGSIGEEVGSSGTVTVDGAGSALTTTADFTVGNSGAGVLNIANGGQVTVGANTWVARESGSTGTIDFDGGVLDTETLFSDLADLTGTGTINTGGLVHDGQVVLDASYEATDSFVLDASGQNITVNMPSDGTGILGAGFNGNGSLSISGGATVKATDGYLGYNSAASGTAMVNGSGSTWATTGDLHVGRFGSGEMFIWSGGLVSVDGHLFLGGSPGGRIRMSSGAMLALGGDVDGSIAEFLGIVGGSGDILYRDVVNNGWLDITGGTNGVDYTLAYMDVGYLAGHTVLTVDGDAPVSGDFNGDGVNDAGDVDDIAANIGGDPAIYDLDGDGDVDVDDMIFFVQTYLEYDSNSDGIADGTGTFLGDSNTDGIVDGTDLSILSGSFGTSTGFAGGDANGDGTVNGTDLSILSSTFGSVATMAVPEPVTMSLLAIGGLVLLQRRRS